MILSPAQNINGSRISVTNASTLLFSLINTAASTSLDRAGHKEGVNSINITPIDGDICVTFDGMTPTATLGIPLYKGMTYGFRTRDLSNMRLIRAGSTDVSCAVEIGKATNGEIDFSMPNSVRTYFADALDATNDKVSTKPIATVNGNTVAYAASLVVRATAGKVYAIRGYTTTAAQWIQIHDAAALPANGTVPEDIKRPDAQGNFEFIYPQGKSFTTGLVVADSSTGPTLTVGAADCWISYEIEA